MRNFLSVADLSREELSCILDRASTIKEEIKRGEKRTELAGKTVALLFQKPSLRTRVSFEQGIRQLGGNSLYLSPSEVGLGKRESVSDVARVLSRYVDCIVARVNLHDDLDEMARYATVPVVNALSEKSHPCQLLADLMTIREKRDSLSKQIVAFIGDGNNVAHSLILGSAKTGIHLRIACPEGYEPLQTYVQLSAADREATGGSLTIVRRPAEAAEGADVLYTDVWASMGQEGEIETRAKAFDGYRIDGALLRLAKPDAIVMHDLPAHRGEEITGDVIDGPQSVVFDQAENRLHAQKGLLSWLFTSPES
ncbi:MAG: ornithine carbamoyltransferase [Chloroflexota bacterium]|jgi:ornithine carbamoyltransferase